MFGMVIRLDHFEILLTFENSNQRRPIKQDLVEGNFEASQDDRIGLCKMTENLSNLTEH